METDKLDNVNLDLEDYMDQIENEKKLETYNGTGGAFSAQPLTYLL